MENTIVEKVAELKSIQAKLDEALKLYKESIKELEANKDKLVPELMEAFKGQTTGAEKLKVSIDGMLLEIVQESEKLTTSYKDAFETALTKVNENTKKVLEQILEASKVTSKVKGQMKIDGSKVYEGVQEMFGKVKEWLGRAYDKITNFSSKAQEGVDEIEAMIKNYEDMESNKFASSNMDDIEAGAVREDMETVETTEKMEESAEEKMEEGAEKPMEEATEEGAEEKMEEGAEEEVKEEGSWMETRAGADGKVFEMDEKLNEAVNRFKQIINY